MHSEFLNYRFNIYIYSEKSVLMSASSIHVIYVALSTCVLMTLFVVNGTVNKEKNIYLIL